MRAWAVLTSIVACAPDLPNKDTGVAYDPGGGGGDDLPRACDDPAGDDMEIGGKTTLPGSIRRLAAVPQGVLACGDAFVAALDVQGSITTQLELQSPCVDIAVSPETTAVLTEDGTVLTLDPGLTVVRTTAVDGTPHGLATLGDDVFVAAGSAGVVVLDASTLEPTASFDVPGARDVATSEGMLLVAAGTMGVGRLDPDSGEVQATVATESPALGVRIDGEDALVLRGAQGWDWLSLSDGLALRGSSLTEGLIVDAMLVDGHAFVVEGHAVVRYTLDGDSIVRLSSEHRPDAGEAAGAWLRAVSPVGDGFALAGDGGVSEFVVRAPTSAADLAVETPFMQLFGDSGESVEGLFLLRNVGDAPLTVLGLETEGPFSADLEPGDETCDGLPSLAPGASAPVSVRFDVDDDAPVSGTLYVETNDPDQPILEVALEGNPSGPTVGAPAPDFTGLTLDGQPFRLSDHAGKVIFLKLFDFGCSTCSEEFPLIQSDLVPLYGDDVVFVGVNKGHRTAYADAIASEAALGFPIVLDIDSQAFARYRLPGKVFPLHVVIDTDGTIALADAEPGLTTVEATLSSLLD